MRDMLWPAVAIVVVFFLLVLVAPGYRTRRVESFQPIGEVAHSGRPDKSRIVGGQGDCLFCNGDGEIGHADSYVIREMGGDVPPGTRCEICGGDGDLGVTAWSRGEERSLAEQTPRAPTNRTEWNPTQAPRNTEASEGLRTPCAVCGGSGRVDCIGCGGKGMWQCSGCRGVGVAWCPECNGRGMWKCTLCSGTGRCPSCDGAGCRDCGYAHTCPACAGTHLAGCRYCGSTGRLTCRSCGGAGAISCFSCAGSGSKMCLRCFVSGQIGLFSP